MSADLRSPWGAPATVEGFVRAAPNPVLRGWAATELARRGGRGRALDLGCGAARNALPLAGQGWEVVGVDDSVPMLVAAAARARSEPSALRLQLLRATMDRLPFRDARFDLLIAHGIWNLATSEEQFRRAVAEASRVAKPAAALFVFTFSRHTLPASAEPVPGERFVFTQFSGAPQCFLTAAELDAELAAHAFTPDPAVPLREYNRDRQRPLTGGPPVIYEAGYRREA